MLLGQFPSVQAMSLAPKIALRSKVSRAAPAKKRGNGRRPRAQSAAERKRMAR